jgi:hypothetical protein
MTMNGTNVDDPAGRDTPLPSVQVRAGDTSGHGLSRFTPHDLVLHATAGPGEGTLNRLSVALSR